jgi:transposase-like protein
MTTVERRRGHRLSRARVQAIAAAHAAGGNAIALADAYRVSESTVHAAVREVREGRLRPEIRPSDAPTERQLEVLAAFLRYSRNDASRRLRIGHDAMTARLTALYTTLGLAPQPGSHRLAILAAEKLGWLAVPERYL